MYSTTAQQQLQEEWCQEGVITVVTIWAANRDGGPGAPCHCRGSEIVQRDGPWLDLLGCGGWECMVGMHGGVCGGMRVRVHGSVTLWGGATWRDVDGGGGEPVRGWWLAHSIGHERE